MEVGGQLVVPRSDAVVLLEPAHALFDAGTAAGDNIFNNANEWTRRWDRKAGNIRNDHESTYDRNGNLTEIANTFRTGTPPDIVSTRSLVYDAFGRLVEVHDGGGASHPVAKYEYNGLGFRTRWTERVVLNQVGTSTYRDHWQYFDERWRHIATYRNTHTSPKERYVYHAAGLAGRGGSSYIDSVILRDVDDLRVDGSNQPLPRGSGWADDATTDGTLETREYLLQNWRADVVAVYASNGTPFEHIRPTACPLPSPPVSADEVR